ncbi:DUF116 domain-containing protein [Alkaliphilus pronyensis]|uniref:DUF116 domain-containing protein n=2 Tax=Alkaliphilus pronyensis TaxID=1482732 RepID=A0A6I0F8Z9_9FIRM|nr:DUF116 domain-containing protein [Alkaliphilus pronyensis]
MLFISILIITLISMISYKQSIIYARYVIIILITAFTLIAILIILTLITVKQLWYNKYIPFYSKGIIKLSLNFFYPIMIAIGKVINVKKDDIRRIYAELNNRLILVDAYNVDGEDMLIITPHCLQKSFCPYKITHNIYNCKRCGKCDVDKLISLKDKYNIHFRIATGGTLARKIIKDVNPKVIIAIACERDLISGLQDVKSIPVVAIINSRPEGPCMNTNVSIDEVEKAIKHFIKE